MSPFAGIVVFSLIETLTVVLWFEFLRHAMEVGVRLSVLTQVIAFGILFIGYLVEHVVAWNVGRGRPLFSWPRP